MAADGSDPFIEFATKHGLRISNEELCAAPRDVLAAPAESERHTLITLVGPRADAAPLRMLFVSEAHDARPASIRDVLWWLASDSWAIEQARGDYAAWAQEYSYPDDDAATLRLFRLHSRQAQRLSELLGQPAFADLLRLYQGEVTSG